MDWVP
jgi:hypothetical protein